MTVLLDVNLLVSLAWPNHVHHGAARSWFDRRRDRWATTPVTESGFVRVSSNSKAIPTAATPGQALALLDRLCQLDGHVFLPDDVAMVVGDQVPPDRVVTHPMVTDAHLLAVARRHGAQLATFDRDLAHLAGEGSDVEVVGS
ncbi:MAG: TA system VapC family ribonuclease toxin [Acidimicrobiales bacterium]